MRYFMIASGRMTSSSGMLEKDDVVALSNKDYTVLSKDKNLELIEISEEEYNEGKLQPESNAALRGISATAAETTEGLLSDEGDEEE